MRFISTKVHGVLDYLMAIILIASPWLLGFARQGAETWVPVVLGASAIIYSLMTNYEFGMAKMLPMRTHLGIDLMSGIFLALSPWIFGYSDMVYLPHLVLGIAEVGASIMTDPIPYTHKTHHQQHAH